MKKPSGFDGIVEILKNPSYRNYTIGSSFSLVGTWVHRVAAGWLTWQLTESGAWLGIIAFADLFTMVLLSPFAGAIADRVDRLWLFKLFQLLSLFQAVAIAILVFTGLVTIELLLGLTIYLGVCHAFHTAARHALVPTLVPHEGIGAAIGLSSFIFNLARFIGPAVAGIIIVTAGVGPAFAFNALSFTIFLVVLMRVEVVRRDAIDKTGGGIWSNIADGYRYTVAHPAIGPLLLLLIVSSFAARSIVDLLPGFAEDVFSRGAAGLAWLTSAMGLGATLAGLWLARRQGIVGLTGVVLAQLVVIAAALIAFVATDIFWVAIPALMLSGFAMIINGVGSQVLIQSTVAGAMRGRVMSLFTLILQGSPAFGTLIIGVVSESIGLRIPVAVAAVLCLAAWLWMLPRAAGVSRAFEGERPG